jgi:hypothetical protein
MQNRRPSLFLVSQLGTSLLLLPSCSDSAEVNADSTKSDGTQLIANSVAPTVIGNQANQLVEIGDARRALEAINRRPVRPVPPAGAWSDEEPVARDARGYPVISDPATAPPGWNQVPINGQLVSLGEPIRQLPPAYNRPPCSRTISDSCEQTYDIARR